MKTRKVKITAEVTVDLVHQDETVEELKNRPVDIYLHGTGENGSMAKIDLGADNYSIEIIKE
jgi:hypothetical protein